MTDALWYLGRGTGVVSLVLLTLVVALGIATRSGRPLLGLPRFAVTAVHRSAEPARRRVPLVHVVTCSSTRTRSSTCSPSSSRSPPAPSRSGRPGRAGARPRPRAGGDQPAARPDRAAGLARGALAGLRGLAGGAAARPRLRHRRRHRLDARDHRGVRRWRWPPRGALAGWVRRAEPPAPSPVRPRHRRSGSDDRAHDDHEPAAGRRRRRAATATSAARWPVAGRVRAADRDWTPPG